MFLVVGIVSYDLAVFYLFFPLRRGIKWDSKGGGEGKLRMPKKIGQTITIISFNILIYVQRNEAWFLLGWKQENKESEI